MLCHFDLQVNLRAVPMHLDMVKRCMFSCPTVLTLRRQRLVQHSPVQNRIVLRPWSWPVLYLAWKIFVHLAMDSGPRPHWWERKAVGPTGGLPCLALGPFREHEGSTEMVSF